MGVYRLLIFFLGCTMVAYSKDCWLMRLYLFIPIKNFLRFTTALYIIFPKCSVPRWKYRPISETLMNSLSRWRSVECDTVFFHWHNSQVHSDPNRSYLLGPPLWQWGGAETYIIFFCLYSKRVSRGWKEIFSSDVWFLKISSLGELWK